MKSFSIRTGSLEDDGKTPDSDFSQPDYSYAPYAFWFWNGNFKEKRVRAIAAEASRKHLNPGYIHARFHPVIPLEFWLSESWMNLFNTALEETAKQNMHATYTIGDPCFPDKRIVEKYPELLAQSLQWKISETQNGTPIPLPESFFSVAGKYNEQNKLLSSSLQILNKENPVWNPPDHGIWKVYSFQLYHAVAPGGAKVNYLTRKLFPAWKDIEHNLYEKRFRKYMGNTMNGIFVDQEGSYGYKLVWSDELAEEYEKRKHSDIRRFMPLLVEEDAAGLWGKARWDWYDTVTHLYADSLLRPFSEWCGERGMFMTCHLWESDLFSQAWECGSFFHCQRAYSMPGTDALFRDIFSPLEFAETWSVAELEGRQSMCEIFGIAGWHTTPAELKKAANCAIAWGITQPVLHGINNDCALERVGYPPDFFTMNPYWELMELWTDFSRRASWVADHGRLDAHVLMLCPMDSVWPLLGDGVFDAFKPQTSYTIEHKFIEDASHSSEILAINRIYSDAIMRLRAFHTDFLIADRHYLERMSVKENELHFGTFHFDTVILPPLRMLSFGIMRLLLKFSQNGGVVHALGSLPDSSVEHGMYDSEMIALSLELTESAGFVNDASNPEQFCRNIKPGVSVMPPTEELLFTRRRIGKRLFVWAANNGKQERIVTLRIPGASGRAERWDCETGEKKPVSSQGEIISYTFAPYEGFWLVFDPEQTEMELPEKKTKILSDLSSDWILRFIPEDLPDDIVHNSPMPDGIIHGMKIPEPISWNDLGMKKFSGFLTYEKEFFVSEISGHEFLDLENVYHTAEVFVNDHYAGARMWAPFHFPIGKFLHSGKNILRIKVGNLILNNIYSKENYNWKWHSVPTDEMLSAGIIGKILLKEVISNHSVDEF